MASAQDLYKWHPLQGEYSGYTNAIRAAQSMGNAIDNLGVRLGDVGKMMADRYNRIQKEDTEYNTAQALTQIGQITDPQGFQEALQNGTLNASYWHDKFGRDFDYSKLTPAVANLSGDTLKRAENVDNMRDYTSQGKQALINVNKAIAVNDPTALYKTIGNGQFMSNKAISNATADQVKQANNTREYGLREISTKNTVDNTLFNQNDVVYARGKEALEASQKEIENNKVLTQARTGVFSSLQNLAWDEKGNLQPGELSKVISLYADAVKAGYPRSQQDFINEVVSGSFSLSSFPDLPSSAQANYKAFQAAYGGKAFGGRFNGITDAVGKSVEEASSTTGRQQPVQGIQNPQPQQIRQPISNNRVGTVPTRNTLTDDGNGSLGWDSINAGEGTKIGGVDSNAFFNLSESPISRPIPSGTFNSHIAPYVDNLANGETYNASTKDGIDYNGEFNSYKMSQGDAKQLQHSYSKTVAKATARLEASANAKIVSSIGLNNKGAKQLINMLTSPELPDKLAQESGANSREQLVYQIQNDLNGKNLKQSEELFKQYLRPLLQHTWNDNTIIGVSADVERRALETARQTGFNPDNLANILSVIADGSLKGDELKTAVTGLSAMTPTNMAFVRNMVTKLQANKDYLSSNEAKTAIYRHLMQNKKFDGNELAIYYGKSDRVQQTEANATRGKVAKEAIQKQAKRIKELDAMKPFNHAGTGLHTMQ